MKLFWAILLSAFVLCDIGLCKHNAIRKRNQDFSPSSIEYLTRHQNVTIQLRLHIDKVLIRKLASQYGRRTRQRLRLLTKELVEEVEGFFKHPSLNNHIQFKLLGTKVLKNNTKVVAMDENATKYLKSYCDWQSLKKRNTWFYSVLLTGLDLYYLNRQGRQIRRSTGRGYMGGMCSVKNSCTLIEWHPRNIGYLLAHEIAHSLGIPHDGLPYNTCKGKGSIMAAKYNPRGPPKTWSLCSRRALKRYLKNDRSRCLRSSHGNSIGY